MDGARFANALVALGCKPADMSWRAGIDVLSFGATKNGALACEALIFFDRAKAEAFPFQRKRGGHTLSKGRFLGAQMNAYLRGDLWLDLAKRANRAADRLSRSLTAIPGVRLAWPTQVNEVFVVAPLNAAGARIYEWTSRAVSPEAAPRDGEAFIRLVCSFETSDAEVDRLVSIVRASCGEAERSSL
jgi:threonine aldolase